MMKTRRRAAVFLVTLRDGQSVLRQALSLEQAESRAHTEFVERLGSVRPIDVSELVRMSARRRPLLVAARRSVEAHRAAASAALAAERERRLKEKGEKPGKRP